MGAGCASVLLVLNPQAGPSMQPAPRARIERWMEEEGVSYELRETKAAGDARRWMAETAPFQRVVVAGGDGTVMEALSGLIENGSSLPLGILPLGTGNLLARALSLPSDLLEALEVAVATGKESRLDVGFLPDRKAYFAVAAGAGWDAAFLRETSRDLKRRFGFWAYVFTGIKNLFTLRRSRVMIRVDGQEEVFRAHTVMLINVGEILGPGFQIHEEISAQDGRLDLAIVQTRSFWRILGILIRLLLRQTCDERELSFRAGQRIEVTADPPLPLEIDGDPIGETPFVVEVQAGAARLIGPG
ncbi:MAG: diacylglycerol kinase family protein [Verrucomicrobiota bacterium]